MKYLVKSRNHWDAALQEQFGEMDSIHELSDAEVVAAIIKHGRAEIRLEWNHAAQTGMLQIEFQNDYD